MSDQTNLTNFSCDKRVWPVYITIGNLLSARHNISGSMAVLLFVLLPIPPKFSKSFKAYQPQRKIKADILQMVFELFFGPPQDMAHTGIAIDCGDSKVLQCFPILSA